MENRHSSQELKIQQNEKINSKEGFEAMLYTIQTYFNNSGSKDLTDILSGGEYWEGTDFPADSAFWDYWVEAIEKVRRDGPMIKLITKK